MRDLFVSLSLLCVSCLPCAALRAEVTDATPAGFVSEHTLVLAASPERAYDALTEDVHLWWDATHSFGGSASGFSLDARANGCFCEEHGDVTVAHMRVVNAVKGRSVVMQGGLGPLQTMAVNGSMSFEFVPHPQGSELRYRYAVGGYTPGGLEPLAVPVDRVQLGQLQRLQQYLATGKPLN